LLSDDNIDKEWLELGEGIDYLVVQASYSITAVTEIGGRCPAVPYLDERGGLMSLPETVDKIKPCGFNGTG